LLAKTLSRKEESKAVLCAFPALRDLFLFFHPPRPKIIFFSRGSIRKNNADKPLGKQKICKSAAADFFCAQRRKEGFDLSPSNCEEMFTNLAVDPPAFRRQACRRQNLCVLSAAAKEFFFNSRKGAETQRGILCVLASLRELLFFFASAATDKPQRGIEGRI
jgi:hypothetical protein